MSVDVRTHTVWIEAVRCENCGDITADEFTGPPSLISYKSQFPVECTLDFVRMKLLHRPCSGRIMLAEHIEAVDSADILS